MDKKKIGNALADISSESDPTLKSQKLASLCSTLFRERGYELVVVGGSAIEFYTDGAYTSGDLDLCLLPPKVSLPLRLRQEIMGELNGKGGPRSWQVAGMFVDVLGELEKSGATPIRKLEAPYGTVSLIDPEELLVERVLVSVYPRANSEAASCARQLVAVSLERKVEMDWDEVQRIAKSPAYGILPECKALVRSVAHELKVKNPLDSNR
ncbi:MAG: hypothetical protein EXS18_04330 [Verrucomicrobiae bacterium]|nr:hypothetical protein [Verrucomicrobiae bacterium]